MSDKTVRRELIEYAKAHLLQHMLAAGMTMEDIEAHIAAMSPYHPLKAHFVSQYVASLPLEQREEVTIRLLPPIAGEKIRITVLTVPSQPSFEVSANLVAPQVDRIVRDAYGMQDDGKPHNWRGDPIETNE